MNLPNKKALTKNKFSQWVLKQANSSWFAKIIIGVVMWAGVLIPTWIYLVVRWFIAPADFWQELAIIVICGAVIGWIQAILIFLGFTFTIILLFEDL
jgi:hypothetical protein